ncbi:S-adenosyl-L-methionine-dependent methyltransferase [Radiomyces spectabilis]|uniref:S-adenosyl-L-methionine-dependent methyltransferase n=1 Tax=Radiomyces spectabilis TaxID=64574 RepID=UPI0022201233|nr:S-adenosyl-L-methionine-dependent methyltransferase [Radiomyces spectabilis]KAI8384566.1 S-adenosyl-L-methionine-dependent methyltransferase [Radiomyces spectabilis]
MGGKPSKAVRYDGNPEAASTASQISSTTPTVTIDGRVYHSDELSSYCLPRDEEEQDRLNSQHFALKALFGSNTLSYVQENLTLEAKILDIGCGSGSWVMEMAIDHPHAHVTGIDMADMFPTMIRPENVKFELANVLNGIPYPDNTFDFVHMRLLIAAFREHEWPLVIAEIFRVLKPNGLVQLMESDFTVQRRQDPYIGSKLAKLLTNASFNIEMEDVRVLDYGDDENPVSREMLWNWKNAMHSLKPLLGHRVTQHPDQYDMVVDRFIQDCDRYHWYVKLWAYCGRKPNVA